MTNKKSAQNLFVRLYTFYKMYAIFGQTLKFYT